MRRRRPISWARSIFSGVCGHQEPEATVLSLAMTDRCVLVLQRLESFPGGELALLVDAGGVLLAPTGLDPRPALGQGRAQAGDEVTVATGLAVVEEVLTRSADRAERDMGHGKRLASPPGGRRGW